MGNLEGSSPVENLKSEERKEARKEKREERKEAREKRREEKKREKEEHSKEVKAVDKLVEDLQKSGGDGMHPIEDTVPAVSGAPEEMPQTTGSMPAEELPTVSGAPEEVPQTTGAMPTEELPAVSGAPEEVPVSMPAEESVPVESGGPGGNNNEMGENGRPQD